VAGEERGLWGSAYYAANPLLPLNKTVANLNMDVLNWFGKTKDIVVVGQGQNELEDYGQAIDTYEASLAKHPDSLYNGELYLGLYFCYDKLGLKDDAEKGIFFLNITNALITRFRVLNQMKNPDKLLEFAAKMPQFNGKPYYAFTGFAYTDFEYTNDVETVCHFLDFVSQI
ncbi:MAG: M28 family peptidase, partial [Chitinophagaceae bacterium]